MSTALLAFDMPDMFVDIVVNLIPRVYPEFQPLHMQLTTLSFPPLQHPDN